MSEGMSGGTYPNRNWPLSLNEKVALASKMAEGRNAPYAMERTLARTVLDFAAELAAAEADREEYRRSALSAEKALVEAAALEQQAKMGWDESRRREGELRAALAECQRALHAIQDDVMLEYREGDRPYQYAILAANALAAAREETRSGGDAT
jgi:hypothetical protein